VIDLDLHFGRLFLGARVLRAADIDGRLVPGRYLDRAIEAVDGKPPARFNG